MRHVLGKFEYDNKDHEVVAEPTPSSWGAHWLTDTARLGCIRRTACDLSRRCCSGSLTTAALAAAIPTMWAQRNVVSEDGYAALAPQAATDPRLQSRWHRS